MSRTGKGGVMRLVACVLTFCFVASGLAAQSLAAEHSHQAVELEHLLTALIAQEGGVVVPILTKIGANPEEDVRGGHA